MTIVLIAQDLILEGPRYVKKSPRQSGTLEVWGLGDAALAAQRLDQTPTPLWETCLQESIRSLSSGHVTGGDHMEIVLATYGGKVRSGMVMVIFFWVEICLDGMRRMTWGWL